MDEEKNMIEVAEAIEAILNTLTLEEKRFVLNHLNLKLKLEENDKRKET